MKQSLKKKFIFYMLVPVIVLLFLNIYFLYGTYSERNEDAVRYCDSAVANMDMNIGSVTTTMKRISSLFSSQKIMQEYLLDNERDKYEFRRLDYREMIDLSKTSLPELVDIVIWDSKDAISLISYLSVDIEQELISRFMDMDRVESSYFSIYGSSKSGESYLVFYNPVYRTEYSNLFGTHIGNIAVVVKMDTIARMAGSFQDTVLTITDADGHEVRYNEMQETDSLQIKKDTYEFYRKTESMRSQNLLLTGIVYNDRMKFPLGNHLSALFILLIGVIFYVIYIIFVVQKVFIHPINRLNRDIEQLNYTQEKAQIPIPAKNEIGTIAEYVNALLGRISGLNKDKSEAQTRIYEMEINKKQTQLYAYQSQINPHFLYNMLQCMRGICLMHNLRDVAQICTDMAELFRYSIKGEFMVRLEQELRIIEKYLMMITIRFQEKITYKITIEENVKQCLIPKMILQPIVENAIFHGLEPLEEKGEITIDAALTDGELRIIVHDNGAGFNESELKEIRKCLDQELFININESFDSKKGLGITNIHNKIRLYEGSPFGIEIESEPGNTSVILRLDVKY